MKNTTEVTIFVLKGLTDNSEIQFILFFLFLAIYLFTLIGNLGLVVLVIGDCRLHNPVYYFLSVLSSVDACYSSVITPKMLVDFMSKNKTILLPECAAQMFLFTTFGTTECFLLAAMAYDRYVASTAPPVFSQHGSQSLHATQHCFPCGWHLACFCTHSGHFQPLLLCLQ